METPVATTSRAGSPRTAPATTRGLRSLVRAAPVALAGLAGLVGLLAAAGACAPGTPGGTGGHGGPAAPAADAPGGPGAPDAPGAPGAPGAPTTGMEVVGVADYGWELLPVEGARTEAFSLDDHRGRPLFINVWATWCPPCVAELESIEALIDSMEGSDVVFLLVSPEDPGVVRDFLARHGRELPVAVEGTRMPAAFGLEALPTTFVVDREGRIVLRYRGAADWDQDPVRALLAYLEGA